MALVNMRKAFLAVQTDDTDTYYGANAMPCCCRPSDPSVNLDADDHQRPQRHPR